MKTIRIIATVLCALVCAGGLTGSIVGLCLGDYGMMAFYLVFVLVGVIGIICMWVRKKPNKPDLPVKPQTPPVNTFNKMD